MSMSDVSMAFQIASSLLIPGRSCWPSPVRGVPAEPLPLLHVKADGLAEEHAHGAAFLLEHLLHLLCQIRSHGAITVRLNGAVSVSRLAPEAFWLIVMLWKAI